MRPVNGRRSASSPASALSSYILFSFSSWEVQHCSLQVHCFRINTGRMIRSKQHVLVLLSVAIVGSLLYFYVNPSTSVLFPRCLFFSITSLHCPGCGSQRAIHELLHGNIL